MSVVYFISVDLFAVGHASNNTSGPIMQIWQDTFFTVGRRFWRPTMSPSRWSDSRQGISNKRANVYFYL